MAKSVLELAVGTGQWDAGLRKAKSALDNFTQSQGGLQQALEKDSENLRKFVSMMGGMESKAKTAKGQMNDYKSTIEQLTMQYNRMTEAQKNTIGQDYLQSIEQMKQKYHAVSEEIQEMNRSLNNVKLPDMKDGGGGLLAGLGDKMSGALQVFAGNMLTKGVSMLTSELTDSVQESIELARQGEGIRIAFERIGRGDLLGELRQATHGTITDLELMKAAVRFDDFKLPLDQLGTMLAFAQQKAKDTGQSFDYMVDSIVTGLGRQSPKILDNLGLSITEIHQKTKETGDMTKAVGEIIREQMEKAGDYVETAADRAARATVDTKNRMEELGRSAMPVAEEFSTAWHEIRNGAMTIVMPVLKTLADSFRDIREILNGEWDMPTLKPGIQNLADGPINSNWPKRPTWGDVPVVTAPGGYVEVTDKSGNVLHGGHYDSDAQLKNMMKRWNTLKGATGGRGGGTSSVKLPTFEDFQKQFAKVDVEKLKPEDVMASPSVWEEYADGIRKSFDIGGDDTIQTFDGIKDSMDRLIITSESYKKAQEDIAQEEAARITRQKQLKEAQNLGAQAAINFGAALASMEDPAAKAAGTVMQAIASIALGFAQASATASELGPWGWVAFLAAGAAAMATTISTVHSLTGYAQGGVIKGNSYSGDNIGGMVDGGAGGFVGLNAGEVVLNAAQQRGVASALSEGGNRRIEVFGRLSGETIYLSSDRYTRRTGRGTIMTWK